jgi:hypothetical protein
LTGVPFQKKTSDKWLTKLEDIANYRVFVDIQVCDSPRDNSFSGNG